MSDCIFCKIVAGEIPCRKLYEDEDVLAFHDIHPVAPVHFMLIPKMHVASLAECDQSHRDVLGKILLLAPKLALPPACACHRRRRTPSVVTPTYRDFVRGEK